MNELQCLDQRPVVRRIKAQALKLGMLHVAKVDTGKYEVARIRDLQPISRESIRIDLGPEGHANRIMALNQYADADIATVVGDQILASCPNVFDAHE